MKTITLIFTLFLFACNTNITKTDKFEGTYRLDGRSTHLKGNNIIYIKKTSSNEYIYTFHKDFNINDTIKYKLINDTLINQISKHEINKIYQKNNILVKEVINGYISERDFIKLIEI